MLIPHCSAHAGAMVALRRDFREPQLRGWVCREERYPAVCPVEALVMFVRSHSQTALVPYPTAKTWPYFAQNRFSNRVTKLMAECCEYHEESIVKTQKSHPREWVDVSIPTYHMRARPSENPTHGSEWT